MRNNLGLFLAKRARLSPRVEAVVEVERGRRFSYAELNARANRAANLLLERGVRAGDRVALLMMNGVEYLECYFGAAKIGAVVVPLNWRLVPDELEFILKDSGAVVLVFDDAFDAGVAELGKRDTDVRHWLRVGPGAPAAGVEAYESLLEAASSEEPESSAADDDLLFIMYTSGTTGLPKGAVHSHGTMTWASFTINMTADMRYRDRYLQVMPLFHVGALTPATACVHRGGTLVIMRAFDPNAIFRVIQDERVTTGLAVPAMLQFMWASPERDKYDLASLRWIMSGAAPVPVSLIEQYAGIGIEIHQVYGLTETCGPACLISPEEAITKAGSTGPAFMHTEVRVVDEQGADVAPGEVGEVLIRGPHVMKGYWKRDDATAETIRNGWLHSGDLASVDKEGFVYIQDRIKDMIISGGENIYPAEIENVLCGHPKLREAAVIGQPSARWGESPLAIVVPNAGEAPSAREVLDYCKGKLAKFKLPRSVEFVETIPRNPSGKILKRLLREQFPGPGAGVNAELDARSVEYALRTTRSVRRRLDFTRPVEPEVIEACIETAIQAPTGGRREGWRFLVLTEPARKTALAALYRRALARYRAALAQAAGEPADAAPAPGPRPVQQALADRLHEVPVLILACIEGRPTPDSVAQQVAFYGSILPAAWSLAIALRARGLGSTWTTLHLLYEQEAARMLGIPDDVTQTVLLPVGYLRDAVLRPAARRPGRDVTFWNDWGARRPA